MSSSLKNGTNLRMLISILRIPRETPTPSIAKGIKHIHTSLSIPRDLPRLCLSPGRSTPQSQPCACLNTRQFSSALSKNNNFDSSSDEGTSSVSDTEVSHFSRLASAWWDPQGSSRLLHLMNPLRHDFISQCLSRETPPAHEKTPTTEDKGYSYLDVGCGGGIFAESAARLSHTSRVIAIDPTPEVLAVAKEHSRNDPSLAPKLSYLQTSIEDLDSELSKIDILSPITNDFENATPQFDVLTLFEVLEHVTSPSTFLQQCVSHLKPGGWLIVSTISRTPISFLTTKVIAEMPVFGLVPPGTHTWSKYIKPDELAGWFAKDGRGDVWEKPVIKGIAYVPGLGWRWVPDGYGLEGIGNYFFGIQKR